MRINNKIFLLIALFLTLSCGAQNPCIISNSNSVTQRFESRLIEIPHSTSYENRIDATEWLIDKIKNNEVIPAGNFFISKPIVLISPKTINMTGQGYLFNDVNQWKKGIKHNNYVTAILPIGNFNVFEIKSREVHINNGLIYTGYAKNYSSTVVYYDTNERLIYQSLINVSVDGKWQDVLNGGGVAIGFEPNIREDLRSEYGSYFDFINVKIRYQNTGVNLDKKGEHADRLSINSINLINVKMWGCKKYLNFQWGSNIKAKDLQLHDFPVLTKDEYGMYAISAWLTDSEIIYELYDSSNNSRQTPGTYRHGQYHIEGNLKDKSNIFENRFNR